MSSRRITSNSTLAPIQRNALNPFSEFNSDNINLLTRIVSGGKDVIIKGLDVLSADQKNLYTSNNLIVDGEGIFPGEDGDGEVVANKNDPTDPTKITGYQLSLKSGLIYGTSYIEWDLADSTVISNVLKSNKEREFKVSFNLTSGLPKCIFITLNGDTSYVIDHPELGSYTITIKRNLCNDDSLKFRFNVLFDAIEDWNIPTTIPIEAYNKDTEHGTSETINADKTIIDIGLIECFLIDNEYSLAKNAMFNSQNEFSDKDIHFTNVLKVTPGIAIKDDVMLDIKGGKRIRNDNSAIIQDASVLLDVSNDNSWIKGKAWDNNTFKILDIDKQYAFCLNGRSKPSTDSGNNNSLLCEIDRNTGKLYINETGTKAQWNGPLLDDDEFKDEDQKLTTATYSINTETNIISVSSNSNVQVIGTGGSHLVFVYYPDANFNNQNNQNDLTRKEVIFTCDVDSEEVIDDNGVGFYIKPFHNLSFDYSKLSQQFIEYINSWTSGTIDDYLKNKIRIYISSGPIKVLSKKGYYNANAVKWAYVVLYYAYFKNPRPNISYIGLAREEEVLDPVFREDYLILAKVRFIDHKTVDIISYNERQVPSFPSSNSINYSNDCIHPEVWQNSVVPKTVTAAIDQLRGEINELKYYMRRILEGSGDILVGENHSEPPTTSINPQPTPQSENIPE